MKLWNKGFELNKEIENYTVGDDFLLDSYLIKYDCLASIAHANMLYKIKILKKDELKKLEEKLNYIINNLDKFKINIEDEDCHSLIENFLIKELGDVGKKIHTFRSRNDQVLTALRLYEKNELDEIKKLIINLINSLNNKIKLYGDVEIPGFTHMQKAMPSSIKLWLNSFVDAFNDELISLNNLYKKIDQNPLGSGAGFGFSYNLDKKFTSKKLNFSKIQNNPMYCQLSRGKFESEILNLLTQIMFLLNKISSDILLFTMKEFSYMNLPKSFCTGSSIMPQKQNYDVLELVRGNYHIILGEEFKIKSLIGNLISGYNRDVQLTKKPLIDSINLTKKSINIINLVIENLKINKVNCKKAMTKELYATDEAIQLVKKGLSFRDAYKKIGMKY
jgi:argininosuccinate lyase